MNTMTKIERGSDATAEGLAHEILIWIAGDAEMLKRFLDLTGLNADDIRSMLGQNDLYAGITGFLMNDEPTLIDFCSATGNKVEWVRASHRFFVADELCWP